jgi:hypothetical protein
MYELSNFDDDNNTTDDNLGDVDDPQLSYIEYLVEYIKKSPLCFDQLAQEILVDEDLFKRAFYPLIELRAEKKVSEIYIADQEKNIKELSKRIDAYLLGKKSTTDGLDELAHKIVDETKSKIKEKLMNGIFDF